MIRAKLSGRRKESSEKWVEDSTFQTHFDQTGGTKDNPLISIRPCWIDESIGRRRSRAFLAKNAHKC
jgi:hypothetical protein